MRSGGGGPTEQLILETGLPVQRLLFCVHFKESTWVGSGVVHLALFDMPNSNRFDILLILIFPKISLSISISISIFSKMSLSISISIFSKMSLSMSISISISISIFS